MRVTSEIKLSMVNLEAIITTVTDPHYEDATVYESLVIILTLVCSCFLFLFLCLFSQGPVLAKGLAYPSVA